MSRIKVFLLMVGLMPHVSWSASPCWEGFVRHYQSFHLSWQKSGRLSRPRPATRTDRSATFEAHGYEFMRGLKKLTEKEEAEIFEALHARFGRNIIKLTRLNDGRWVRFLGTGSSEDIFRYSSDHGAPARLLEFLEERQATLEARFGPQFKSWHQFEAEIRIGTGPVDRTIHSEGPNLFELVYSAAFNLRETADGTYVHGRRGNLFRTESGDDLIMDGLRTHAPPPESRDGDRVFVRSLYWKDHRRFDRDIILLDGKFYWKGPRASDDFTVEK